MLEEEPAETPYNMLLYTGRRLVDITNTYDFRARQYSPKLGRFMQRDPAGMIDSTNLYTYTNNNPLSFNDPDSEGTSGYRPVKIQE